MKVELLIAQEVNLLGSPAYVATFEGKYKFYQSGGGYLPEIYLTDRERFGQDVFWQALNERGIKPPVLFFVNPKTNTSIYRLQGSRITTTNVVSVLQALTEIEQTPDGFFKRGEQTLNTDADGGLIFPADLIPGALPFSAGGLLRLGAIIALFLIIINSQKNGKEKR